MSGVDSRVVTMKFDNAQFEQGASTTMSTLDKLKASLNFSGAGAGLENLTGSLATTDGHVSKLSAGFVALGTMAVTAIANVTNKLISMGTEMYKSMSGINAMKDGFSDYELKIGATQTIMAGTGENIGTVTKYLKELDTYADQTIYSLSDMTNNIGKFTNAGVKLPVAVEAMKGISNAAALSGAGTQEAANSMYNFGQAIGEGHMSLMNWRSIDLANMGTKEFKQQLIDSAVAAGTLKKSGDGLYKTLKGNEVSTNQFTGALKDQWMTADVVTTTLSRYADGTKGIGKKAQDAAVQVKTFSMMMETLSAAAGTGWTDTFEILIGNLPEATELWTGLTNTISGFISKSADARNKVLGDWKKLGGRTDLIEGIKNVFNGLKSVLAPIGKAFRDIFPASTGKQLAETTKKFREFTSHLKLSGPAAENLKRIFKGLFSVFSIAWQVIKGVASAFGTLFGAIRDAIGGGGGGILALGAHLGDIVSGFDEWLKKTDWIGNALRAMGTAIGTVVGNISALVGAFVALFTGDSTPWLDGLTTKFAEAGPIIDSLRATIQGFVDKVKGWLGGLTGIFNFGSDAESAAGGIDTVNASIDEGITLLDVLKNAWKLFIDGLKGAPGAFGGILSGAKSAFTGVKDFLKDNFSNVGLQDILSIINTGVFIQMWRTVKKFVDGISDFLGGFEEITKAITDNLGAMEKNVKATAILKIGVALLLLAIAVEKLSRINVADLVKAMVALVIMLKILTKSLESLAKESEDSTKSGGDLIKIGVALILLALAILILAKALEIIGKLDPVALAKGLITIAIILAILVKASEAFEKAGGAKDLMRVAVSLGILSVSLMLLAAALKVWDALDASTIFDSIWKIALVLVVLGQSMKAFPSDAELIKTATSILIVAAALVIIALALKIMGSIPLFEMIKGLAGLAVALFLISTAVKAMEGSKGGAVAILAASAAILLLAFALKMLASIPWQGLLKGIAAIAALLAVITIFAAILAYTGLIVVVEALGQAMLMMGFAMMAAGVGMMLFAAGLAMLAAMGSVALQMLITMLPLVAQQLALAVIAWVKIIGDAAPVIGHAFVQIVTALIDAAREILPKIPPLLEDMLDTFLEVMYDAIPKIAQAGLDWLLSILTAISRNIYRIVTVTLNIIRKYLQGLADGIPKVIDAGVALLTAVIDGIAKNIGKVIDSAANLVVKFMQGLADAIDKHSQEISDAGGDIAEALVKGIIKGIGGLAGGVWRAIKGIVSGGKDTAMDEMDAASPSKDFAIIGGYIPQGMAMGIEQYGHVVDTAIADVGDSAIDTMRTSMEQVADAAMQDIDVNPVIAPVLDLSQVRKEAGQLGKLLDSKPLKAGVSFGQATSISADRQTTAAALASITKPEAPVIQFEQNNYSPKELSAVEIYRQTKNQLSLAKGALVA